VDDNAKAIGTETGNSGGTEEGTDELFMMVRKRIPRISLGTVYRNLDRLVAEDEIQKIATGEGITRFDGTPSPHYHIRCIRCGRVDDVPMEYDSGLDKALQGRSECAVMGHSIEFKGMCPECRGRDD